MSDVHEPTGLKDICLSGDSDLIFGVRDTFSITPYASYNDKRD